MKSQKVTLQKSQKLLAENLHERPPIQNIQQLFIKFQRRVIVTAVLVLAIVRIELRAREASSLCDFWKWLLGDFILLYSYFTQANDFCFRCAW